MKDLSQIYLESRLSIRGVSLKILRPIQVYFPMKQLRISCVQVAFLAVSLWVCHTRLTDNFHHPTDVLTGIVFGAAVGYYTVRFILLHPSFPAILAFQASHIAGLFTYKERFVPVENPEGIKFLAPFVFDKGMFS